MPVLINQPSNQIRLTNVSLVRMRKAKKRFEIACYKNKVLEWRSGAEKDLDNVLQIPNVFLSVSKGQVAPSNDLAKAFGEKTVLNDIILEILSKGELQVGEKERNAQLERVHREVIDIVAGKLVDTTTQRVYTTGMIEKALDQLSTQGAHTSADGGKTSATEGLDSGDTEANGELKGKGKELPNWTGVVTTRSAKSQALDAMKSLIAHQPIPIARARMRLCITCPVGVLKQTVKSAPSASASTSSSTTEDKNTRTIKDRILGFVEQVESQDVNGEDWEVIGFVEPGSYKTLSEFVSSQTKGKARAEVLDMAVVNEE